MLVNTQGVRLLILVVPHWLSLLLGDLLHAWLLLIKAKSVNCAYTRDKRVLLLLHRLGTLIELSKLLHYRPLLGNTGEGCWIETDFLHNLSAPYHARIHLMLRLYKHLLAI